MRKLFFSFEGDTKQVEAFADHLIFFEGKTLTEVPAPIEFSLFFNVESGITSGLQALVDVLGKRNRQEPVIFKIINKDAQFELKGSPVLFRYSGEENNVAEIVVEVVK